jgi:hypothetical protein
LRNKQGGEGEAEGEGGYRLWKRKYYLKRYDIDYVVKVKFTLEQATNDPEGKYRYSSTLSLTSALDWGGRPTAHPAALTPGKTRYQLYSRLGEPQGRSGRVRKITPPPGFKPLTIQLVASRLAENDDI